MSTKVTIWAWRQAEAVPNGTVLLTLLALADIARDHGKIWASHRYIAAKAKQGERTVRASISTLEEIKLLRTEPTPGRPDVIWLNLTATTLFEEGPGTDEPGALEKGPRRPRQDGPGSTPAGAAGAPAGGAKTPAGGADEPIDNQEVNHLRANALVGQTDEVRHAFELYNRLADKIGATRAAKLNDDRKRRLKARLKDASGIEGWARALERVERSAFLTGQTHHHFSLTLDFLIQPSSFTKLIEGQYEDRNDGGGSPASPTAGADRGAHQHSARVQTMVDGAREALNRRRRWT